MNPKNKAFLGVVSATLLSSAMLWEGDKRDAYYDIVGVLTVCYGHTGSDIVKGRRYSKEECTYLLKNDLVKHQKPVLDCTNVPLSRNEVDAYTLFATNVGGAAYCRSSLLKKLNAGDHVGACNALTAWSYAGGKYVQGLNNRRVYERQMCLGGLK
jgi:lysozyme